MGNDLTRRLTDFDADVSPNNPANVEAARQRGLSYDFVKKKFILSSISFLNGNNSRFTD